MARQRDRTLKDWIGAAEAALLQTTEDGPADRFSWLADGLLRRAPEKLWALVHDATKDELMQISEPQALLTRLARTLVQHGQLATAAEVAESAKRWDIRLDAAVARELAHRQLRAGDIQTSEETIRRLLRRDPDDVAAIRLLYRVVRESGRAAEAHDLLTRLVDLEPSAATATFALRERSQLSETFTRTVRIALLSSYVVDPLVAFLDVECRRAGLGPRFYIAPFNQYTQEVLGQDTGLYRFAPEIVFIALDLEDLFPPIRGVPSIEDLAAARAEIRRTITTLVEVLRERLAALIVVHELAFVGSSPHGILDNRRPDGLGRWTEDINRDLADALRAHDDVFLMPLGDVLPHTITARRQGQKLYYMARMRHGETALRAMARSSMRYVKPRKGLTRKCVVVDLDGTLWGGVAGEVAVDGIQLGPNPPGVEYMDFQQALLNLTKRGILLAVCSKNNPEDVLPILREHRHMVLREHDFSAMRVNWRSKVDNLVDIAAELNIGLDALVFFDDNPAERALVRAALPDVLTVEVPRDASQYRSTLEALSDFELLAVTREDELRAGQYQANRRRRALESSSGSVDEYLHALDIRAQIGEAEPSDVARLVQMFNKTNQFNTTTRRYQTADVTHFVGAPTHRVYALRVTDRFGDHGLVGAAVVCEEAMSWRIDSFLLSCRVMGLGVETAVLSHIGDEARAHNVARLVGEFAPTPKNAPAADLYRRHGFRLEGEQDGTQRWVLDPRADRIESPAWITRPAGSARR